MMAQLHDLFHHFSPFVYLLQTASQTFLGGKELPQDHCYCLLPSLDTAKWRHE